MNSYLTVFLCLMLIDYLLDCAVFFLTLRSIDENIPNGCEGLYDPSQYVVSQNYTRIKTIFFMIQKTVSSGLVVLFVLVGGFGWVDQFVRAFNLGSIPTGLCFMGIIVLLLWVISFPFSIYSTFSIEERFGFNTTAPKLFFIDTLKSLVVLGIIAVPLCAAILWFFQKSGSYAWLYCWIIFTAVIVLLQIVAPVTIMPLFNKFIPLVEGELQEAILSYASSQMFKMKGVYTMDGSKRSNKANAFVTGVGGFRRIVFFDNLVEKLRPSEVVAVLAHEIGHSKHRHIGKKMIGIVFQIGLLSFILSLLINNQVLFDAFSMDNVSVYGSLVLFGFFCPLIFKVISIPWNAFSRYCEYQADQFAVQTTGKAEEFIAGLKKLAAANFVNLTPHPLVVFLSYSHPPILQRIEAIRPFWDK